jgi:O-antigen ligase
MADGSLQQYSLVTRLQTGALLMAHIGVLGMAVSMPISRAVFNLSAAIMIIGWLISGGWRVKLQTIGSSKVAIASIAFFALCALSLFWTPKIGPDQWDALRGYSRILYIPVMISLLTVSKWRRRAWTALLTGMLFTLLVYLLDIWFEIPGTQSYGSQTAGMGVFYHHIAQGMVLSFLGAYALHQGWGFAHQPRCRWFWWAVAAITATGLLTVGQSRTGQLSIVAAYAAVAFSHASGRTRFLGLIIVAIASMALVAASPNTQERLALGWKEAATFQQDGERTSVGARLRAWEFSWQQIRQAPWLGHGIGTYREQAYANFQGSPICQLGVCEQPHNQFLMTAVEIGVMGIGLLLAWILTPAYSLYRSQDPYLPLGLGYTVILIITAFFDSPLKIQGQQFFLLITVVLLTTQSGKRKSTKI